MFCPWHLFWVGAKHSTEAATFIMKVVLLHLIYLFLTYIHCHLSTQFIGNSWDCFHRNTAYLMIKSVPIHREKSRHLMSLSWKFEIFPWLTLALSCLISLNVIRCYGKWNDHQTKMMKVKLGCMENSILKNRNDALTHPLTFLLEFLINIKLPSSL